MWDPRTAALNFLSQLPYRTPVFLRDGICTAEAPVACISLGSAWREPDSVRVEPLPDRFALRRFARKSPILERRARWACCGTQDGRCTCSGSEFGWRTSLDDKTPVLTSSRQCEPWRLDAFTRAIKIVEQFRPPPMRFHIFPHTSL